MCRKCHKKIHHRQIATAYGKLYETQRRFCSSLAKFQSTPHSALKCICLFSSISQTCSTFVQFHWYVCCWKLAAPKLASNYMETILVNGVCSMNTPSPMATLSGIVLPNILQSGEQAYILKPHSMSPYFPVLSTVCIDKITNPRNIGVYWPLP